MALNAYLQLVGTKLGKIDGSVTQKGREGRIMVIAASHDVTVPRDPASGMATGKRVHHPLVLTKELDKASPLLWRALAGGESFSTFELEFWAPQVKAVTGIGAEVQNYTVKLAQARLMGMRFVMASNKDPELMKLAPYEELSFVYQAIQWIWNDGGITASDTWSSGAV